MIKNNTDKDKGSLSHNMSFDFLRMQVHLFKEKSSHLNASLNAQIETANENHNLLVLCRHLGNILLANQTEAALKKACHHLQQTLNFDLVKIFAWHAIKTPISNIEHIGISKLWQQTLVHNFKFAVRTKVGLLNEEWKLDLLKMQKTSKYQSVCIIPLGRYFLNSQKESQNKLQPQNIEPKQANFGVLVFATNDTRFKESHDTYFVDWIGQMLSYKLDSYFYKTNYNK